MTNIKSLALLAVFFGLFVVLFSARVEQSCLDELRVEVAEIKVLIDRAGERGLEFVGCGPRLPLGMSNSLIRGYSDMDENGVYHPKIKEFNNLEIYGVEYKKTIGETSFSHSYYYLKFDDKNEQEEFENFYKYSENYIEHGKSIAVFFRVQGEWFLSVHNFF